MDALAYHFRVSSPDWALTKAGFTLNQALFYVFQINLCIHACVK